MLPRTPTQDQRSRAYVEQRVRASVLERMEPQPAVGVDPSLERAQAVRLSRGLRRRRLGGRATKLGIACGLSELPYLRRLTRTAS
jgi:hypothetical protein